jgi:hypothetical protein
VSDVTSGVPRWPFFCGVAREYYVCPSYDGRMDSDIIGQLFYVTTISCYFLSARLSY